MKRYLKGTVLIIGVGILMSIGVFAKYKNDIKTAQHNYIQEEHYRTEQVVTRIEDVFDTIYDGLRIITRLPGVKNIDRYAQNFDLNARRAVHEIYNNIANNVDLSEIYIVPLDFDPDRYDEHLGSNEEPIIVFDDRIVGRTALSKDLSVQPPNAKEDNAAEIEIHEYRVQAEQLTWMKANIPQEQNPMDLKVPAVSGPEVITCDNTHFNPEQPDDRDRLGVVYSLPLYDYPGELKGMVSGVILRGVLERYLPTVDYVLTNRKYDYRIMQDSVASSHITESRQWIDRFESNPDLIYSEAIRLAIVDTDNEWYVWAGRANEVFWQRQDARMANQFAVLGLLGTFLLTGGSIFGYFLASRHSDHLETMNKKLVKHQKMLEDSQHRLKRFSGALLSVREEEKKSLSRDIHDTVGSMAIGLNAKLKVLEDSIKDEKKEIALKNADHVKQSVRTFVRNFKHIALSLRPPQLEDVGLAGALEEYCEEIARVTALQFKMDIDIEDQSIPDDLSIALYRVVQEALNNIIKHAQAAYVRIRLHQQQRYIYLDIIDDGIGFDMKELNENQSAIGIGIIGIRERIESFHGTVKIDSSLGHGTRLYIKVPVAVEQNV